MGKTHISEFSPIQFRIPIKRRDKKRWENTKASSFPERLLVWPDSLTHIKSQLSTSKILDSLDAALLHFILCFSWEIAAPVPAVIWYFPVPGMVQSSSHVVTSPVYKRIWVTLAALPQLTPALGPSTGSGIRIKALQVMTGCFPDTLHCMVGRTQ